MTKKQYKNQAMPIPDDWNGEDWFCIQWQWPNSKKWIALLTGIMSQPMRGRWWDENTGIIIQAQEIGQEIWNRNIAFNPCGESVPDDCTQIIYIPTGDCGECEECMSCFLPIGALKMIDGVLHYRTCDGYLPVEGWTGTVVVDPPPEGENEDENDPSAWPCNKAAAIASALFTVMSDIQAAVSGLGSVYEMYGPVNQVISAYGGTTWSDAQAIALAYSNNKSDADAMLANPDSEGWFRCIWSNVLAPTDTLNSSEQYAMLTAINQSTRFTSGEKAFPLAVFQRLGLTTWQWVARLSYDNVADCACPDEPLDNTTDPIAGGWVVGPRYDAGIWTGDDDRYNTPEGEHEFCFDAEYDVYGIVIEWQVTSGNTMKDMGISGTPASCLDGGYEILPYEVANWTNTAVVAFYFDDVLSADLYAAMGASRPLATREGFGNWSDVVNTPVQNAGDTVGVRLSSLAEVGESVTTQLWVYPIYNVNDDSH